MQLTEPHYSVMYQEDLKLENYAISVAHLPPGNRFTPCPVPDPCAASFISSRCLGNAFFLLKILQTNKKKRNLKSYQLLGCLMSHSLLETFWNWFSLLCQLYQAEILLKCCSWRCPPCSDDTEVKKLVTIFLSARLSSQGQFYSTNVLADDSEVWPWLWHVTCTLETTFLL